MQVATFFSSSATLSASAGAAGASTAGSTAAAVSGGACLAQNDATPGNASEFESLLDSQTSQGDDAGSAAHSFGSQTKSESEPETNVAVTAPDPSLEQPLYASTILAAAMAAAAIAPEPTVTDAEPATDDGPATTEPQVISCGVGEFENVLDDTAPATASSTRHAPVAPPLKVPGSGRETNAPEHDSPHHSAATPNGVATGQNVSSETRRTDELPATPATPVRTAATVATPAAPAANASPVFSASPTTGYKGTPHPRQIALAPPGTFGPDVRTVPAAPATPASSTVAPVLPTSGTFSAAPVETAALPVAPTATAATAAPLTPANATSVSSEATPRTGVTIPAASADGRTINLVPLRAVQPEAADAQVYLTNPETEFPFIPTAEIRISAPVRLAPIPVSVTDAKPIPGDTEPATPEETATDGMSAATTMRQPSRLAPLPPQWIGEASLPTDVPATEPTAEAPTAEVRISLPGRLAPIPVPVREAKALPVDEAATTPTEIDTSATTLRQPPRLAPLPPQWPGEGKVPAGVLTPAPGTDLAENVEEPDRRVPFGLVRTPEENLPIGETPVAANAQPGGVNPVRLPPRLVATKPVDLRRAGQELPDVAAAATVASTPDETRSEEPTVSTGRILTAALAAAWTESAAPAPRAVSRREERTQLASTPASIFDSVPASAYEIETVTLELDALPVLPEAMQKAPEAALASEASGSADPAKTPPANERALNVASPVSALSSSREIPSASRGKIVPVGPRAEAVAERKNLQVADEQRVTTSLPRLGTGVAEKVPTMPAHALPTTPNELLKDFLPTVQVAQGSNSASRANSHETAGAESTQLRSYAASTVKEVVAAAERLVPPRTTVELRLQAFEQENVRVQLIWREGTIHARFITETPELQQALTHEWANSSGRFAEKGLKFGEATFEQRDHHHQASGNAYSQEQHGRHRRQYADREFPEFALPSFLSAVTGRAASVPVDLPSMSGALHPLTNSQRGLRAWA